MQMLNRILRSKFCLIALMGLAIFKSDAAGDDADNFADFYAQHSGAKIKVYESCQFLLLTQLKVPIHLKNAISGSTNAREWRIGSNCRRCEEYVVKANDWDNILADKKQVSTVPTGYFIRNSNYHASIVPGDGTSFIVTSIFLNSQRNSSEEVGIDLLTRLDNMPVDFGELSQYSDTSRFSWDSEVDGTRRLECTFLDQDGDSQELRLDYSQDGYLRSAMLACEAQDWYHDYTFLYENVGSFDTDLLAKIERKCYSYDRSAKPIVNRWVFRDSRRAEITESDCRLPAFGIAEPEQFRFSESKLVLRFLLFTGVLAIIIGVVVKFRARR